MRHPPPQAHDDPPCQLCSHSLAAKAHQMLQQFNCCCPMRQAGRQGHSQGGGMAKSKREINANNLVFALLKPITHTVCSVLSSSSVACPFLGKYNLVFERLTNYFHSLECSQSCCCLCLQLLWPLECGIWQKCKRGKEKPKKIKGKKKVQLPFLLFFFCSFFWLQLLLFFCVCYVHTNLI